MKEAIFIRFHSLWFYLYDTLEKVELKEWKTDEYLPRFEGLGMWLTINGNCGRIFGWWRSPIRKFSIGYMTQNSFVCIPQRTYSVTHKFKFNTISYNVEGIQQGMQIVVNKAKLQMNLTTTVKCVGRRNMS